MSTTSATQPGSLSDEQYASVQRAIESALIDHAGLKCPAPARREHRRLADLRRAAEDSRP